LDDPNDSEEDCEPDDESDIHPGDGSKASETAEHWVGSPAPIVP